MRKFIKIIFGLLIFGLFVTPAFAQSLAGSIPFGGTIVRTLPCLCSGNLLITISPVAGSPLNVFQWGFSRLFEFGQLYRPGAWLLGNTLGSAPCVILTSAGCVPLGNYPLISIVGTSI